MSFIINPYVFGVAFDADYQAILTYAQGQGYTLPGVSQRVTQNQLVLDLKSAGIWSLLDIFYVFATNGDSDFATLNWKSPSTFQCTKVNSPTFTPDSGFSGNAATQYLNTGFSLNANGVNYTLTLASVFHYVTTGTTGHDYATRNASSLERTFLDSTNGNYALNRGLTTATTTGTGFYLNNRNGSLAADHDLFKGGVLVDGSGTTSNVKPSPTLTILAAHNAAAFDSFSDAEVSVLGVGASLLTQQSDLYNAFNTYLSSL